MLLREKWDICTHETEGIEMGCFEFSREKDNAF